MQTIKIRCLVMVVLIVLAGSVFIAGSRAQKKDAYHLFAAVTFAAADAPEVWERFRGLNGSSVSPDSEFPVEFGPRKNVLWSTPALAKGKILVRTSKTLFCFGKN